ncbi:unnamed protein product [Penicillium olsonii]|uniref:Uncharacterized protein n=1 Tax=Penicillium olsonii TaxID=99116 RepID=A0A9W4ILG6_PENOL|nr:unnamed protein product [Penicillium olsonii]
MIFELVIDILQSSVFRIIILVALSVVLYGALCGPQVHRGYPLIGFDMKDGYSRGLAKAQQQWIANGKDLINQGLAQASFQEFFGSYPGFEPFALDSSSKVVVDTVKGRLTQSLNLIIEELADETDKAVDELFGNPEDWTEITYKPELLKLVSRISSRVFVGPELCENEDWRNISTEYAVAAFVAARTLRQWNFTLRPVVHWFLPECRQLRATLRQARQILKPVIEKRRLENRQRREHGESQSKVADTIGWMDEAAKGKPYDAEVAQIGLSLAAIHTTTEMVSGLISDLCANPEYFEPLREEINLALAGKGWSKKALQDLKLMDSAMKESQRHHLGDIGTHHLLSSLGPPCGNLLTSHLLRLAAMNRMTVSPVTLSDGTQIPKGALTMVDISKMHDASVFPDPHSYKGDRFFQMRHEPGQEQRWQFVSTAPEHLAFGHGKHACPGRFFAANEIRVILIFLLMNYDWKFTAEGRKADKSFGQETDTDPTAKAMIRRRKQRVAL